MHSHRYGLANHIGYHYRLLKPLQSSTQHIKTDKLPTYVAQARSIGNSAVCSIDEADSFLGRMNFGSGVYLRIKQHMFEISRCRHMPNRLSEGWFPLSFKARADALTIAKILEADVGLPLMCDLTRPHHASINTVTHRADACLGEKINGFGIYFTVPDASGQVQIYALMDTWTDVETQMFDNAGGVPAAEACAALFGVRAVKQFALLQKHHSDLLQLSDSITTAIKFASLKLGAEVMNDIRDAWLAECETLLPCKVSIEHIWREYNVGSDLLSKQQYELFEKTIMAAGLSRPTRIYLSPENRDLTTTLRACTKKKK